MRHSRRPAGQSGFTLIEVVVALAIAAGALVMLLSANSASLQKSVHARQERKLGVACDSTLDGWLCNDRKRNQGDLDGFPGWSWKIRIDKKDAHGIDGLRRVTLTAYAPGDVFRPAHTLVAWDYVNEALVQ